MIGFKDRYSKQISTLRITDIGFEDYYLIHDLACHKYNIQNPDQFYSRKGMRVAYLYAIYNDGHLNKLYDNIRRRKIPAGEADNAWEISVMVDAHIIATFLFFPIVTCYQNQKDIHTLLHPDCGNGLRSCHSKAVLQYFSAYRIRKSSIRFLPRIFPMLFVLWQLIQKNYL